MANYMSNHSSNHQLHHSLDQDSQTSILASCYTVEPSTSKVHGFHYCTTLGAGSKSPLRSPPLELPASGAESSWPGNHWPGSKGEAAHTIPEECERLFCDKLTATFLGEGSFARQESLGMDAFHNIQHHDRVLKWIEVWDYFGDAIYRGFVTETDGERTLFVFLEENALGQGLKSGLIALFELAGMSSFGCSQIVACVSRSQHATEMELVRNLGWCGFSLTTLEPWTSGADVSSKWLFLGAEV
ncbi:hypothetical protein N7474_007083 [Penicillium riverlandense]|uniref:uncharacterized protein n=1 Tax=Penicillium riverlandense TaxID=1903569 RepID=UPI002547637A|nr:uncharacterized protein N7474_007083 [Penicillium riverlandense]KAJ5815306.1 hypothetical protein N7474_007083 [Penicillium riverlandense]